MRGWLVALFPVLTTLSLVLATPAGAEKLVSTVSNQDVLITSSFDGAKLSLFGSIEPDQAGSPATGPYNIIVAVTGPLQDRITRLKTSTFGVWSNTDEAHFRHFPSFYAVYSSGKLENIATPEFMAAHAIHPEMQALKSADAPTLKAERYSRELVRLMTEDGHIVARDDGVRFLSATAFVVEVDLPSAVVNGRFLLNLFVLKDRLVVAERNESFSVRKSGFESFVYVASRQQPLLYGLVGVALALSTGWLAGVVFKR